MGKKKNTNKEVVEALLLTLDSLKSHIPYSKDPFHRKCVDDYAKILEVLIKKIE